MQHGFLDPGASLQVPKGRALVPNIRRLIDGCRRAGAPVVYTQFVYSPAVPCLRGDPFGVEHLPSRPGRPAGFGSPSSNCLIGAEQGTGAESAGIVPELAPNPNELVVSSHTYDKFLDTPLDLALRSRDILHLLVCGVTTDVCVNSTVLSAANRNYRVTVVSDAVATLEDSIQAACFTIWRRKFARLRTTSEVITELKRSSRSGHPETQNPRTTRRRGAPDLHRTGGGPPKLKRPRSRPRSKLNCSSSSCAWPIPQFDTIAHR
jgi:nicotinamidase-related amidase